MPTIDYNVRTTKDSVEVNLYKTGSTDTLISAHTITNTFGVENTFSYSDQIFENGTYKIILMDSLSATTEYNNIDVSCFVIEAWKFTIQTDAPSAINTSQFTLPTVSGYNYDAIIDWGDGNQTPLTGHTDTNKTHTYSAPGTYQISITGLFEAFSFNYGGDRRKLITLDSPILMENNLSYIVGGFRGCTNLTSICNELFMSCQDITSFNHIFNTCTSLTTLPNDLFRYNTAVTDFSVAFGSCTSLTTLPNDLFKYNTAVTTFDATFYDCKNLTTLPVNLFRYNSIVTSFSQTFFECINLTTLAVDLFIYNSAVTDFSYVFDTCTSLTTLPNDLFRYNTAVTNFSVVFNNCTSLTTLPNNLFKYNTNTTSFSGTFYSCISLTALPVDIFRYNTAVTTFRDTFSGCYSLTIVPENLFYYNNLVTDYENTFISTTNISLPTTLFNLSNLNIVTNLNKFLYVDNSIKSSNGIIQDIWNYATGATHSQAFYNQTLLTNYASIPTNWK